MLLNLLQSLFLLSLSLFLFLLLSGSLSLQSLEYVLLRMVLHILDLFDEDFGKPFDVHKGLVFQSKLQLLPISAVPAHNFDEFFVIVFSPVHLVFLFPGLTDFGVFHLNLI